MTEPAPSPDDEPVSVLFTWSVVPGREADFERWLEEVNEASSRFPGHQGVTWLRPGDIHEGSEPRYHCVLRFRNGRDLSRWLTSPEREVVVRHLKGIAEEAEPRETTTGMETWFSLPGRPVLPPPRWKMTIVSFLGVYPCVLVFQLLGAEHLGELPLPPVVRAAILPMILAPILTYLVMPWLSRTLRRFLYDRR
ncbi:antibiotic biosynthesis monooxygenase [Catellatospora methionotrophica]|uniref:antibiotic biosynthesis monooxygenase n=1 Tax=Catellatospora methionotrophica TaxID=121620 RepID=UPI0033E20B84